MKKNSLLLFCTLLLSMGIFAQNAVWQWSELVRNAKNNNGISRAYLWIPENCKKIRGVVFAQNNMEEQSILESRQFRDEMAKLNFAEVWVSPGYDLQFVFTQNAGETFTGIMNDLADVSGYNELKLSPIVYMGHSAAASAPYYFAAWNPGRTLACISVSGQWPYVRNNFAPDIWGKDQNIDFIPCLETMGEYEAANTVSKEGLKERKEHPLIPLSMLSCPAEFHFSTTDEKNAYIAFYIKKAAQYRLPKNTPDGIAPQLISVDPTRSGWLVDRWRFNEMPTAKAAPVGFYKGNPDDAFWFFDEETALATEKYQIKHRNKKPQLIGYMQGDTIVAQRNTHQQFNLKFEPEADGITFKIKTAFYNKVPDGSPRLPKWTELPVGASIGHSNSSASIKVDRITGPFVKLNDSTFRVNPRLGFWRQQHSYEFWFSATDMGDEEYKPAVQQAQMLVPPKNTEGLTQTIIFDSIADQKAGTKGIILNASSDKHVPVSFYVQEGPAILVNSNKLDLTKIPPRTHYPVKVVVVAWQYGNSNEPKLQTADQVTRTFWIRK